MRHNELKSISSVLDQMDKAAEQEMLRAAEETTPAIRTYQPDNPVVLTDLPFVIATQRFVPTITRVNAPIGARSGVRKK